MLRTLIALAVILTPALVFAQEAGAPPKPVNLKTGDKAPTFVGQTDEGKPWKSADHVGKKVIVVYFYPKDMTPGCTKQACAYRDMREAFADKKVEIIGVSGDTVESHQKFKKEHELNFTLLSDPKGEIAKAFGVPVKLLDNGAIASRWTFIIDLDGRIAHKDDKVDAAKDTAKTLKVVEGLPVKTS